MTAAFPNLVGLLQGRVQDHPDQLAYVFLSGEELRQSRLTYRELDSHASAIAGVLRGLKAQGERALLLYPPGLEFIAAFFGCLYAGVIAVPAYPPRLNRNALRILSIASDSEATLALTSGEIFARLPAISAHTPELSKLRWIATDNLDSQSRETTPLVFPRQDALAYLQYTSGSTADPKGVMVTHRNVLDNSAYLAKAFRHSGEDTSLSWLPHFHDLGLVHGILQPLYSGFPGYLMAPMSFLQRPLDWLKAISRVRVTHSDGPNFAYDLCVNKVADGDKQGLDLSTWRIALNGAEPVFPETIERFTAAFAACGFRKAAFYPAYGLAEATLVVSGGKNEPELTSCSVVSSALEQNKVVIANGHGSDQRFLVGSGAFAAPMSVEIVDPESGLKCAPDTVGEIWVSGPSVALGYWNRPEETARVFKARLHEQGERDFLRTGDLGFVHRGNIFVTGRLKELIIVRGRNYYPQDIERTARESCPGFPLGTGVAFSVSIGTEERVVLVQEVQRRQKVELQEVFRRIRDWVAEEHELQLLEIVLVQAGSIPKTSSGKLQRRLCRKEFLEGGLQVIGRWQANAAKDELQPDPAATARMDVDGIQTWLRSRIASRLGLDAVDVELNRSLLHFGLDSLGAVELAHDVQKKLGIVWQASAFLEDMTVADLAARAAQAVRKSEPQENPSQSLPSAEEYPLSLGQQGLWFLHQLSPESAAYNIVQAIRISSEIDLTALRRSFQALVTRHAALRTTFAMTNNMTVQRVRENAELSFHAEDARHWSEVQLDERLAAEAHKPFNLEYGPLFRVNVFSRSDKEHILVLAAHHIILDLWSLAQLMAEFGVIYPAEQSGAKADLPLPTANYAQFVHWQTEMLAGDRGRQLWSYWSRQLAGELPVLELPTDHIRPAAQTYGGSSCPFKIDAELTWNLKKLAQDCNATLYMTLLGAFHVLLHRYTREQDIVVGSPTAGRTRDEFSATVGYFVNPVALRANVSSDCSFQTFLSVQIRKIVLEALEHQDYPFTLLTERLQAVRDPRRSPIFQIMFAVQKAHLLHEQDLSLFALGGSAAHTSLGGLEMQSIALEQRIAQFDLSLIMAEAPDGLAATFEYNTDLFDPATIGRMARNFQQLLKSIADDREEQISRLSLLTEIEARQMIQTAPPASAGSQDIPVHQLFEQQAARTPLATAIVFEGQQLSYRELNERSNQFAHYLRHSGVQPGTPVGICLDRSTEMITSLLGVFKSGAVYVPLDPEYPRDRLEFLLRDSGAEVLITRERLLRSVLEGKHRVVYLEAEEDAIARESVQEADVQPDANSPAYIIYTSGSTGVPKGVLVSHNALTNQMQWLAGEFPLNEHDRVLHKYSLSFDASLSEIFHPLITGAALVIARAGGQHDLDYVMDLIREQRVTEIDVVPTMLKALLEQKGIAACRDLRRIISGGETLIAEVKQRVYDRLGPLELVNMYGPTESTITATFHRCVSGKDGPRIAIGVPIANTQVCVLDNSLQPVPVGVVGEIHIGGRGLASGYLNQPALTAEKFVPDPFSRVPGARLYRTGDLGRYREPGILEHVGRADTQTKIRGFRIELGEIEQELRKHSCVRDVVVVVRERSGGEKYIAAYVEAAAGESITSAQVRAWVSETLPRHMMPAAIVVLDRLPRLPSGKADLRAFPEPANAALQKELAPPRDHVETALVSIWEQVLGRRNLGIHDNFFELGGDSILGIQAVARAREIGLELTPKQILQFQTIAELARNLGRTQLRSDVAEMGDMEAPFPLTPIEQWFFQQDLKAANHYSQSLLLELRLPLDVRLLREALQRLILRHDALRLRFDETETGWQQRIAGADAANILEYVPLPQLPREEQLKQVDAVAAKIRTTLDLAQGPIIRAAYFDLGDDPHRLFITIHHLAVDAVSWRILLDDLQYAYDRLKATQEPAFAGTPLPFQRWSELLQHHAQSEQVRQELAFWTAELHLPLNRLPVDHDGNNTAESAANLHVSLSCDETRRLLHEFPRFYRTEINDVLLAALAQTLARWTSQRHVLIDVEGHGREEIIDGVDPSATIGWFTTIYPVRLEIKPDSSPGERLKSVKEHLRRIPRKGIGFGLLRYLCADEAISRQLKAFRPQVSFNYLGQLDQTCSPASPFRVIRLEGPMSMSFDKRSHLLEIDAYVKDNSLQLEWTYSTALHDQNTIEALAFDFLEELRGLIRQCSSPEAAEYAPSDFPLVRITERQLMRIQEIHERIADMYPLSPMQQGMLFHSLYEPQRGTYLTQLVCEFSGDLDQEAFQGAWQAVVGNHVTLRSEFEWEIVTEQPVQVVREALQLKWHFEDWSCTGPQEQLKLLDGYLRDDRAQPVELRRAPLMRFALFAAGGSKHVFVWSSHHLLMDGWSLPLVLKNVFTTYGALCRKQRVYLKPERPYRHYIEWLKRQDPSAAEKFWRGLLQGFTAPITLEPLRRSDSHAGNAEDFCEYEVRLSESETAELCGFARRHHLTLSSVMHGIWAVLLSRIIGDTDVVFGSVVSGRRAALARADEMVGVFINTLPVRARVESGALLSNWLIEMQERQSEATRFEHTSLSSIQSWSEVPRGLPLFDNILVFENYPAESWNTLSGELRILNMRSFERSNYPLTVWIVPGSQLGVRFGYDALFLDKGKVTALAENYRALLAVAGTVPEQKISDISGTCAPFGALASATAMGQAEAVSQPHAAATGSDSTSLRFADSATPLAVLEPAHAAQGEREGEEQNL